MLVVDAHCDWKPTTITDRNKKKGKKKKKRK